MAPGSICFVPATVLLALPLSLWVSAVTGQDGDFDIDIARIGLGATYRTHTGSAESAAGSAPRYPWLAAGERSNTTWP